jgi:chromosome segregation ATPase
MPEEKSKFQVFLATSRSVLALFRESAIIFLIVFILIWPDALQNILKRAGFSELDLGFLKWQKEIEAAKQDAQDANQILAQVQKDITETKESIEVIKNTADLKPDTREEINKLTVKLEKSSDATTLARDNLQQNIALQNRIINEYQSAIPAETGPWAILVGADKDEKGARYEFKKFKESGFDNVQIYIKSGWYRTAIVFDHRDNARRALSRIKEEIESAYIVNLTTWCPRSAEKEAGIVYECR